MDTNPDRPDPDCGATSPAPDAFTIGRQFVLPVPGHLRALLAPAEWTVHEWTELQVSFADTTHLRIGSQIVAASFTGSDGMAHFRLRFENELGFTTLQPLRHGRRSAEPIHLEVIAKKFPDLPHSLAFMNGLLTDIFARGATLPFAVTRRTTRTIRDEHRAPNDLFAFHFFRHHHEDLIRAVQAVLGSPHRVLGDRVEHVRIHEVRRVDGESLLHMLRTARGNGTTSPGASALHRLQPERVLQRIPEETFDTPENRYILSVARRMFISIRHIRQAEWFPYVQEGGIVTDIPETFDRLDHHLRQLVSDRRFTDLGESFTMPSQSRVLQNKDGYRELTRLWEALHRHQRPVYERMQRAIDLRDVTTLYEFWLLFELIDGIRQQTGVEPHMADFGDINKPKWSFRATFPGVGRLIYQASYGSADIYSGIRARPDFVWETVDGRRVVMDAKFALGYSPLSGASGDEQIEGESWVMTSNIGVMHGYRDAMRDTSAAIVLFPGNRGDFRSLNGERIEVRSLSDLLPRIVRADLSGVGAIPISPVHQISIEGTARE